MGCRFCGITGGVIRIHGCGVMHLARGAVGLSARLFQHQWLPQSENLSIAAKELLIPIVLAVAVWGHDWQGMIIGIKSEYEAVVAGLKTLPIVEIPSLHTCCGAYVSMQRFTHSDFVQHPSQVAKTQLQIPCLETR